MSCEPNPSSPNLTSSTLAVASPEGVSACFAAPLASCLESVTFSPGDDVQRTLFWGVSPVDDVVVNLTRGLGASGGRSSTPHHGHPTDLGTDLDWPSANSALNGGLDVSDVSTCFLGGYASIDATTLMSFGIESDGDVLVNISSTALPVLRSSFDADVDTKLVAQVLPAMSWVNVFGLSQCVRASVSITPCGAAVMASLTTSPDAFITSACSGVVVADPTSWVDIADLGGYIQAFPEITACGDAVLASLMTSPGAVITSAYARAVAVDPYERRSRRLLRLLRKLGMMDYVLLLKAGNVDDTRLELLTEPELDALGLPVGPRARLATALGLRTTTYWSRCRGHQPISPMPNSVTSARWLAAFWYRTASAESLRRSRVFTTLADRAARSPPTSSAASAVNGLVAADATAAADALHNHVVPTFTKHPPLSYRLLPTLPASTVSFERRCGALPEDVARLCYWNALALCRQPLCTQIRVFTKAVRERDALDAAWLEGEGAEADEAFYLSIEAWNISRWWPRRRRIV